MFRGGLVEEARVGRPRRGPQARALPGAKLPFRPRRPVRTLRGAVAHLRPRASRLSCLVPPAQYWPDCKDFEEDICTTCECLGREHCPYDADNRADGHSVLCDWKARGAVNWLVRETFKTNRGSPADHLRSAFHETGQFFVDGKHGSGDDGSLWYELNKKTAPARFSPNFELWAQNLDLREKAYRKVNRCGASAAEACRWPCEEICEWRDPRLFSGFKIDGSVHDSCDHSDAVDTEDADVALAENGDVAEAVRSAAAAASERKRPVAPVVEASRARGGATTDADVAYDVAPASASAGTRGASSGRGLLAEDATDAAASRRAGRHFGGGSHPTDSWPKEISTPFWQDPAWPKGTRECYKSCRRACRRHYRGSTIRSEPGFEPGYAASTGSHSNATRVRCAVSFADFIAFAGASSVEVTSGPTILRHVRGGRCDANGPDPALILPAPMSQSVRDMTTEIPFFKPCHCGGDKALTALTGAHTLGHAHSRSISDECSARIEGTTENARNMDNTPFTFDNDFWKGVARAECGHHRVEARRYESCTSPYTTEDYADAQGRRLAEDPDRNDTVDTAWYLRRTSFREPPESVRCARVDGNDTLVCSESRCGNATTGTPGTLTGRWDLPGCVPFHESTGCQCDVCGLDDVSHCTGKATCGTFHSDQMLWATRETADRVRLYAEDQEAFFKDYLEAHVRMAHVGCESCGPESWRDPNPCVDSTATRDGYHRSG